jgi:hypothetical protein
MGSETRGHIIVSALAVEQVTLEWELADGDAGIILLKNLASAVTTYSRNTK